MDKSWRVELARGSLEPRVWVGLPLSEALLKAWHLQHLHSCRTVTSASKRTVLVDANDWYSTYEALGAL